MKNIQDFNEVMPRQGVLKTYSKGNFLFPKISFDIEIPLEKFKFGDEEENTSVRLESISLPVRKISQIKNKSFTIPVNPNKGYIDGSVYLAHVHNPVDVTLLKFGNIKDGKIDCQLSARFDFSYEGPKELGKKDLVWNISLLIEEK